MVARSVKRTLLGRVRKSCCSRRISVSSRNSPKAALGVSTTARNAPPASTAETIRGASMRAGVSTHSLWAKYSRLCASRRYAMRWLSKPAAAWGGLTTSVGAVTGRAGWLAMGALSSE